MKSEDAANSNTTILSDKPTDKKTAYEKKPSSAEKPGVAASGDPSTAWPLYGPYMGKYVVYSNDTTTAWIISDDFYGKFSSSLYQRLTAGANMGGVRIARGYVDLKKKSTSASASPNLSATTNVNPVDIEEPTSLTKALQKNSAAKSMEEAKESEEEVANAILEEEMEKDYNSHNNEDPNRLVSIFHQFEASSLLTLQI